MKVCKLLICLCAVISVVFSAGIAVPQEEVPDHIIGEAFGKPVTSQEFLYYYKTASMFTRLGIEDRDEDVMRYEAWQNLIFRQGARELGLKVEWEELKAELERLLSEKDVIHGTDDYYKWVKELFNEDATTFERRIEDLLIVSKLTKLKGDPEVVVTEEEMEQKFRNQYNSFESEYILFESKEDAEEFHKKLKKNPRLWKDTYDEKKPEGQKGASWINVMSLEALIDLWKIPKDDAYNILKHKPGDFIVSEFFYGTGVFRLLRKKEADMEKYDEKKREYYRKMLTANRKRKLSKEYFDDLIGRASLRDYVAEAQHAAKVEELKTKAVVALDTTLGVIKLKLFPDVAPLACENFIGLIEKGFYDGITFHRVIEDFMIQGGDPTASGGGGDTIWEGNPFVDEVTDDILFDKPGLLAMANSGANTNKSQFFITVKPTPNLNKRHTIFGEVIDGYDVVEKINKVKTDDRDKPKQEQKIVKASVVGGWQDLVKSDKDEERSEQ